MAKNKNLTPFLSKKELAELKYAEKKLLEIQKMLEEKKKEFEKEHPEKPIIFKGTNE